MRSIVHESRSPRSIDLFMVGSAALLLWLVVDKSLSGFYTPPLGVQLTYEMIWLAVIYYGLAVFSMPWLRNDQWRAEGGDGRVVRWLWTLGWLFFLAHVGAAFHHSHHWSHWHALERTREQSSWGEGIYLSYLFAVLWGADVVAWWVAPGWYARRSRWFDGLLHGYLAFITFNATVVFGKGAIQRGGAILFGALILSLTAALFSRLPHKESHDEASGDSGPGPAADGGAGDGRAAEQGSDRVHPEAAEYRRGLQGLDDR
jgi:hypothetical protein